ncbi:SDR family oxidoreductase [Scrofimicrobium sp. R131]|uniref:SDR family oxidoreductase n=1 Tax=Scrofimicrobium appendicitidis TaxID=3079930 RepID=A0AAU7V5Z1_9ACTO
MENPIRTVAIIGGHGKIAQLLTRLLVSRGDRVLSVVRNQAYFDELASLGAEPIIADIEAMDARDLAPALTECDAVVFAAGAGPGSGVRRKRTVDYGGSILSQQAALEANAQRFIQISALSVYRPVDPNADEVWQAYVRAKEDADKRLRRTTLDWTILRPGTLTDDPATGMIRAAKRLPHQETIEASISRADVAQVVADCLSLPETIRCEIDLVSGQTPIREALIQASNE